MLCRIGKLYTMWFDFGHFLSEMEKRFDYSKMAKTAKRVVLSPFTARNIFDADLHTAKGINRAIFPVTLKVMLLLDVTQRKNTLKAPLVAGEDSAYPVSH